MKQFTKWAEKEYGIEQRIFATLLAGILFVVLIPLFLRWIAANLDQRLGLPSLEISLLVFVFGFILVLLGLTFALWSIIAQLIRARGTPLPMMAPKKLLITGPFKHCRNPMTLGTILLYSGIGILLESVFALIVVFLISTLLIIYLKQVEERELEARFGEAYLAYKKETPFLIPKIFS